MYIDDGAAGDSGELKIDVDGHEYVEQENFSYEHDNVVDSVSVDTAHGDHLVYTDTGHTGTADLVTEYDAHEDQVRQAHFDAQSGRWVEAAGDHATTTAGASGQAAEGGGAATINVDTADGEHGIGPATVDTNNDGRPDTAVVHDANGTTVLYTDSHGDGQADIATEITADGHVVIAEHTGPHRWTAIEHGHLDGGQYRKDIDASGEFTPPIGAEAASPTAGHDTAGHDTAEDEHWAAGASARPESGWAGAFSGTGSAQGVVRIDATTGQWISQN